MKNNKTKNKEAIAYTIPITKDLNIEVQESANAWWLDRQKIHNLIAAFSVDATIREACASAGVTEKQYKYFAELHPIIREVRNFLETRNILKARISIINAINNGNIKVSMWYLEKKRPEEFGKHLAYKTHNPNRGADGKFITDKSKICDLLDAAERERDKNIKLLKD
jgi:hypothetical protein